MTAPALPRQIQTEEELEEIMTRPSPALVEFVRHIRSPLLLLGAGGKMGPTMAARARRAATEAGVDLNITAVSRFSDGQARRWLEERGCRTISCDLMDPSAVEHLPDAQDVIYMVGFKFGTQATPFRTWAVNTMSPAYVSERFNTARIVALSSGNVYPLVPVGSGGSRETDPLTPLGEYANACVARERIFEYFAREGGPRVVTIRLNYAADLKYGVLIDIARKIEAGEPVDVTMGHFNCIWQGDANDMILRSLDLAETDFMPINLTGPDPLSVRRIAESLADRMGKTVEIIGEEADTALLSNASRAFELLGEPEVDIERMLDWTAEWIRSGGSLLGKPTHFEVRDGRY